MRKLFWLALLAAIASASTAPYVGKLLGFGPATAHAADSQGDDNSQGDENDNEQ